MAAVATRLRAANTTRSTKRAQIIAAASFNSASWVCRLRSNRMRSLPKPANQPCVRSTTQRWRPSLHTLPLNATPGDANQDASAPQVLPATSVVVAFVCMQFAGTFAGCPDKPLIAGIASTHGSNSIESCLLAPLTRTTNGMPRIHNDMAFGAEFACLWG